MYGIAIQLADRDSHPDLRSAKFGPALYLKVELGCEKGLLGVATYSIGTGDQIRSKLRRRPFSFFFLVFYHLRGLNPFEIEMKSFFLDLYLFFKFWTGPNEVSSCVSGTLPKLVEYQILDTWIRITTFSLIVIAKYSKKINQRNRMLGYKKVLIFSL